MGETETWKLKASSEYERVRGGRRERGARGRRARARGLPGWLEEMKERASVPRAGRGDLQRREERLSRTARQGRGLEWTL